MQLGKLDKVNIRDMWKNEATEFTKWLAKEDNLTLLGDEIGISMNLKGTEQKVGSFTADILAEEESTGKTIVIENQLEQTDHDHLGKLITYGSGFEAGYLIWISRQIREEHRRAIDWLNERTDNELHVFAINMEVWKIGDSLPAPKFQIICSPNDWAKAMKNSVDGTKRSETNLLQLDFWSEFSLYIDQNSNKLKSRKSSPQHWYNLSIGNSQAHIGLIVSFQKNFIRSEFYIPDNKDIFHKLNERKEDIEAELGYELVWEELPKAKASRIKLEKGNIDLKAKEKWVGYYSWFVEIAEKYVDVFPKYW